jgi:hypothetical protein
MPGKAFDIIFGIVRPEMVEQQERTGISSIGNKGVIETMENEKIVPELAIKGSKRFSGIRESLAGLMAEGKAREVARRRAMRGESRCSILMLVFAGF